MKRELETLSLRLAARAATSRAFLLTQPRCVVVTSALAATPKSLRQARRRRLQLKPLLPCTRAFLLRLRIAHDTMAMPPCLTHMRLLCLFTWLQNFKAIKLSNATCLQRCVYDSHVCSHHLSPCVSDGRYSTSSLP